MSLLPVFYLAQREPLLRSVPRAALGSFAAQDAPEALVVADPSDVAGPLAASTPLGEGMDVEPDFQVQTDNQPFPIRRAPGAGASVALENGHREVVLSCLDSMALAARHRELLPLRQRAAEERRILALSDALFVTPGLAASVVDFWQDVASEKDPWKAWAVGFTLACLDGDDVPEAMLSWSSTWEENDSDTPAAAADALLASPRADRARIADNLAQSSHPPSAAFGIEANARSQRLPVEELVARLQKRPALVVRLALLRAAARAAPNKDVDRVVRDEVLELRSARHAYEVFRALALRGRSDARELLHDRVFRQRLGPLVLRALALVGDRDAAQQASIAREVAAHAGMTSEVLLGLGYYGHPGAAPVLLRCLGDADLADEAERALHWIFGPPRGNAGRRSPEDWRVHLEQGAFLPYGRYRFGQLYRPGLVSAVATHQPISYRELQWLLDEAAVRTGMPTPPEPRHWGELDVHELTFSGLDAAFLSDPWAVLAHGEGRAA